jgi:hypothetical protein
MKKLRLRKSAHKWNSSIKKEIDELMNIWRDNNWSRKEIVFYSYSPKKIKNSFIRNISGIHFTIFAKGSWSLMVI